MPPRARKEENVVETAELQISVEQFMRTRDSVVTGLTTLQNAVGDLLQAYLKHTNTVIGGGQSTGLDTLAISNPLGANVVRGATPAPAQAASAAAAAAAAAAATPAEAPKPKRRKREKKEKDPNEPPRPLTAYFLYAQQIRPEIKREIGDAAKPGEVGEEATRRWHAMSDAEKKVYQDQYKANYVNYQEAMAKYKASIGANSPVPSPAGIDFEDPDAVAAATDEDDASELAGPVQPPKEPTPVREPTPAKAPKPKRQPRKAKENGVKPAAPAAASPAAAAKEKSPEKKRRGTAAAAAAAAAAKDQSPEEPKRKKARKSKGVDEAVEVQAAPAPAKKETKGGRKRKSDA